MLCSTIISTCDVKPVLISEESEKPYYLTPWDLPSLNFEYIEFGLVFNKPNDRPLHIILDQLKASLATTLTHFFPLSGRFVTQTVRDPPSYCVYVDCKDPAGAKFVHAVASSVSVSHILTPTDVPYEKMKSLFALAPGTLNAQGHHTPLLAVQVTELLDGIFIAFSINHAVADGTSAWHFINSYSEACRSATQQFQNNYVISRPPVTSPWFLNNNQIHTPGSHPTVQGSAPLPGTYRHRVFHFTSKDVAHLKKKANQEYGTQKITSYKALAALIWRSTTRARGLKGDQITTCAVPINSRSKLQPPLSNDYFGNCISTALVSSTVDDLLSNNLGWAAWQLHSEIISCDGNKVRSYLEQFTAADCSADFGDPGLLFLGSSPWHDVYGNNFGWGNPIAVRWSGEIVDGYGYVHILAGRDNGSIDVMMSLCSKFMDALEIDSEFMDAQSTAIDGYPVNSNTC